MEFVYQVIFPALATIVTGLATWGVTVLIGWLNSKIKNDKIRAAVTNVRDIITAAVAETSQTFVDDLKKNGKFSPEDHAKAFEKTLEAVKKQLTAEATAAINAVTNDVDAWIAAEIEKAVKDSKKEG